MNLQITKYNPLNRDDSGKYLLDEWTEFSDIGKTYNSRLFTYEEYCQTEEKYIKALEILTSWFEFESFYIIGLNKFSEKFNENNGKDDPSDYDSDLIELYNSLNDGSKLNSNRIGDVTKLILRNKIWGQIIFLHPAVRIRFSYDYYMTCDVEIESNELIKEIETSELFVERIWEATMM